MYLGLNRAVWSYGHPIEDFGCISSHAQSTTNTYFSGAVNSDVAHVIMVCWAFLLQSFGAEQIGDTKWPTKVFAHACVEIQSMSTPFMCVSSRNKTSITTVSFPCLKYHDDDDDDDVDDYDDDYADHSYEVMMMMMMTMMMLVLLIMLMMMMMMILYDCDYDDCDHDDANDDDDDVDLW